MWLVAAVCVSSVALAACSSSAGDAPGSSVSRSATSARTKAEAPPTTGPAALEGLDVRTVKDVRLASPRAEDERAAAAVTSEVRTIVQNPVVRGVRRDGDRVGWLVAWTVPGSASSSEIFRTQFVVQLVGVTAGKNARTRAARIGTTPVAVRDGKAPAVAWFDGPRPVLLVTDKGEDPASLAAALRGKIPAA